MAPHDVIATLDNHGVESQFKLSEVIVVVSESALRRSGPQGCTTTAKPSRSGGVTVWAAIAVVWLVIAAQALVRWIGFQ
jgi:hypothetical protein